MKKCVFGQVILKNNFRNLSNEDSDKKLNEYTQTLLSSTVYLIAEVAGHGAKRLVVGPRQFNPERQPHIAEIRNPTHFESSISFRMKIRKKTGKVK
jgi:hypothetical protein